jgi:ketosteroid isomerase-like protein
MKMLFGLALAMALIAPAAAGPAEDEADVTRMMQEYLVSFVTLDAHRIAAHFNEPFVFIWANGTAALATRDDLEAWLKPGYVQLKARGYARSEWTQLRARTLGNGVVIVSAAIVRYKTDGSVLETLGSTYLLRKGTEGWKIAAQVPHAADAALVLK